MGLARLDGKPFRLDPDSIQWSFSTKAADKPTVGGKIIQIFGTAISDMTITGSFGVGGWQQQAAFLKEMKMLGQTQERVARYSRAQKKPFRFSYPPRGWEFGVYLKSYGNPAGGKAIQHEVGEVNPKWQLVLFIVEDNSGLKTVAQNAYISRLSKGIGWKQTDYNGPLGAERYIEIASGGLAPMQSGGSVPEVTGDEDRGMGNGSSDVARWQPLVAQYFPGNTPQMMCLMKHESGGNPNAKNDHSTAMGLFQVMASVWAADLGLEPNQLYDPETNVKAAKHVYDRQGYQAWPNTSRKCRNEGVI